MVKSMMNECFINGVLYKCRTCFDPATTVYALSEECSNTRTCQDILNDIVKLKTNNDEFLPKTVCSKCLDKLASCYDFILHIRNVNEKYHQILASGKHSSENDGLASSSKNITKCLVESATALALDRCVSEIKCEDEHLMSYDIVLNSYDRRNDSGKEDICDPYMETLNEDVKLFSDNWQNQQRRSPNEEINQVLEDGLNDSDSENSSTSTDESDFPIEQRKKKDKINNSSQRFDKQKNDGDKIDEPKKSFLCYICKRSFHKLSRLRFHIQDMHKNKTNPRTKLGSSSSSDSEPDAPNSQTFGNKSEAEFSKYFQIEKVNGHYVCGVCKKSFTMQNSCRRHIIMIHSQEKSFPCGFCDRSVRCKPYLISHLKRIHPDQSYESNKKQLGRLFGERLYSKPLLLPRAECKLCCTTFTSKKTLLQHLDSHSEASTLDSLKLSSDVIQRWFSNMKDLQVVKTMICKDIREKQWIKYYTILNDFCYEISISDTDAEDLEEETEVPANKYNCELCSKDFLYKYQAFAHLREDHLNEDIPLKCSRCKLEFISTKMYELHRQTHCRSEHKLLICFNCPGKFLWLENMKIHNCLTKTLNFEKSLNYDIIESYNEVVRSSPKTIIRCGLCEMTFDKLRDLRQHMPLHADGDTGVDFNGCTYVNQFENLSRNRELLQQKIKNAFTKRQISRLYQAIDKYGKEIDISDSETDEDDADCEKRYVCELCYETSKKRKLLFNHQIEQHKDVSMPFTCKECKVQYVSIDLLEQHLKKECWNEHRRVAEQCACCKESFIWPENMLRHKEILRYIRIKNSLSTNLCRTKAEEAMASSNLSDYIQNCYCFLCPNNFSNTDLLNDHLMRHRLTPSIIKTVASTIHSTWWPNGLKTIKCKICDEVFLSMAKLNEHFSSKDPKNLCGTRQHSLANYSITNHLGFELHLELDSETETECIENEENKNKLTYNCGMCNKSFKRKYEISQHQRSMHNYELLQLKCERCFFKTVSQKVLDYHRMSQCFNVEKKHQCDQCNFKFMWQENIEKHISIFHTSNVFVKVLNADSATNLNDGSNINSQCLESEELFQNDLSSALNQDAGRKCIQSKYKFQCLICGIYIAKKNYSEHIRKHKCDKSYKCNFCEMAFISFSSLKNHKRMCHKLLHTDETPYKCTLCSKLFRQASHLASHMRFHSGEKPKTQKNLLPTPDKKSDSKGSIQHTQGEGKKKLCPICGVYFSYKTNLKIHIRSHKGERTFKCDLCDKACNTRAHLNQHRRTHFTEVPKCSICEKTFLIRSKLETHMLVHMKERPSTCEICHRAFKCDSYLKQHRTKTGHHTENN